MNTKARDLGFISSLILIIIIALYLGYDKIQSNGIETYLSKIGNNVLELIPEGPKRVEIAELYTNFLGKVKNREIEPERVEELTARIINLTHSDSIPDPDRILEIMQMDSVMPPPSKGEKWLASSPPEPRPEQVEKWEVLEHRLQVVMEFEESVRERIRKREKKVEKFKFQITKELKVLLKRDFLKDIKQEQKKEINESLQHLEQMEMIAWEEMEINQVQEIDIKKLELEAAEDLKISLDIQDSLAKIGVEIKNLVDSLNIEIYDDIEENF